MISVAHQNENAHAQIVPRKQAVGSEDMKGVRNVLLIDGNESKLEIEFITSEVKEIMKSHTKQGEFGQSVVSVRGPSQV